MLAFKGTQTRLYNGIPTFAVLVRCSTNRAMKIWMLEAGNNNINDTTNNNDNNNDNDNSNNDDNNNNNDDDENPHD